jgi:hypothetical protein
MPVVFGSCASLAGVCHQSKLPPKLPLLSGLPCMIFCDMVGLFRLRAGIKSALIILLLTVRIPLHPCVAAVLPS